MHLREMGSRTWDLEISAFGACLTCPDEPGLAILRHGITFYGDFPEGVVRQAEARLRHEIRPEPLQMARACLRSIESILHDSMRQQIPVRSLIDVRWTVNAQGALSCRPSELLRQAETAQRREEILEAVRRRQAGTAAWRSADGLSPEELRLQGCVILTECMAGMFFSKSVAQMAGVTAQDVEAVLDLLRDPPDDLEWPDVEPGHRFYRLAVSVINGDRPDLIPILRRDPQWEEARLDQVVATWYIMLVSPPDDDAGKLEYFRATETTLSTLVEVGAAPKAADVIGHRDIPREIRHALMSLGNDAINQMLLDAIHEHLSTFELHGLTEIHCTNPFVIQVLADDAAQLEQRLEFRRSTPAQVDVMLAP